MNDEIDFKELATFYFQDKLSKFCPSDKTERPNGFEVEMFRYGYEHAMKEKNKKANTLALFYAGDIYKENKSLREALTRIEKECARDDTTAWKIASDALEIYD